MYVHTPHLEEIDIFERTAEQFSWDNPDVEICIEKVIGIDFDARRLYLSCNLLLFD